MDALPAIPSQETFTASSQSSQKMDTIDLESLFAGSLQDDDAFTLPASSESQLPLAETMGAIDSAALLVGWSAGEFLDGVSGYSPSHSHAPISSATSHGSPPGLFNAHLSSRGMTSPVRVHRETTET